MPNQPTLCISCTINASAQDTMQDFLEAQQVLEGIAASYTVSRCGTLCVVDITSDAGARGSAWGMFVQCLYRELEAHCYA